MRDFARRLAAIEAQVPRKRVPTDKGGADSPEARDSFLRLFASIVSYYRGEWKPGDDAFAALERGSLAPGSTYQRPELFWAVMQINWRLFGSYGPTSDPLAGELEVEAWKAIGPDREELWNRLEGIAERYPELDTSSACESPVFFGKSFTRSKADADASSAITAARMARFRETRAAGRTLPHRSAHPHPQPNQARS